jgi:hypothetical protein
MLEIFLNVRFCTKVTSKIIQKILNKKSLPKCQDKWNNVYNEEFHWPKILINLKRLDISIKIKEFQWKRTLSSLFEYIS